MKTRIFPDGAIYIGSASGQHSDIVNATTLEVNITTKDHHYSVVKVNCSDVHYHIVVKVNTYFNILFYTHIDVVTITE